MKLYVKYHNKNCKIESHGAWFDLRSAEDVNIKTFESHLISLGVSIQLPKYFQANIVPRSGTYGKYGIIQANHYGVIDGPDKESDGYSGDDDIWKFNAIAIRESNILVGYRICQFEIKPMMTAPWWVKLKWLFNNKIELIEVQKLTSKNRGGFGSSGE